MKVKILTIFALGMGIFTAGTWAVAFWIMMSDGSIYEPNFTIATIEFSMAVFLTLLSLIAFIRVIITR